MKLSELLQGVEYYGDTEDCDVISIIHDSRKVKQGSLFIAIKGFESDGHDYILDAVNKGAVAIMSNGRSLDNLPIPVVKVKNPRACMSQVSANFFNHPSKKLNIIGVTGTNGKTSITQLLYLLFNANGMSAGTLGTLGFSTPSGMLTTGFTTPESVEVQQLLNIMDIGGVKNAIMEVSSHALELNRVDDVDVNIAIFTNLTQDHLDFHGSMENYFQAKLKLFLNLNKSSTAIVNIDNDYGKRIAKEVQCNLVTYGFQDDADLSIIKSNLSIESSEFLIKWNNEEFIFNSNLIGYYNLENLLAAIATALISGIPIKDVQNSVNSELIIPGRMEKFDLLEKGFAIVDYAHTPDAYEQILSTIKYLAPKKSEIITVFGCGGDRDIKKRPIMAKIAEKYSDKIIVTSDNPRNEKVEDICENIKSGFDRNNHKIIYNRKKAIDYAIEKMNKNSILLILGKGRNDYEHIGNEKYPHSDIGIIKSNI
ncbi:MAG: UDP-N-acetylmuramoyl-L-alanyl-D-glutamate--2,6-diaminopimelate ligase [Candidatus Marinimicrobia bacterium]|nr:UDP-N-acetylmuramoyl-L-alanyl-D-glutamate--2,6-diaminopimelate ligase [Candidatus Neomarinimicrobiota bacterium]